MSDSLKGLRNALRHYRAFFVILLITLAVWYIVALSDHKSYPMEVRIEWCGFDSARYAVLVADTVLPIVIESNGFHALSNEHKAKSNPLKVEVYGDSTVRVERLLDVIEGELELTGVHSVKAALETISIRLAQRRSKTLAIRLRDVRIAFAEQFGLAGAPRFEPDSIVLYGSEASLQNIDSLFTAPAEITEVSDSGYYILNIDPVWARYPDVRPSSSNARLYLPVERYAEKRFSLPVHFVASDVSLQARLYPETVTLTVWAPTRDHAFLQADQFDVEVYYNPREHQSTLPVRVVRFPSDVRIKNVEPSNLQYVIIK